MLSVYNDPSQSDSMILWSKVSSIFIFLRADRHTNKVKNKQSFDVSSGNFQGMQKITYKWEEQSSEGTLYLDKLSNFVDINFKEIAGISFTIALTKTFVFYKFIWILENS